MSRTTVSHPMGRDCLMRLPFDEPSGYSGTNAVDVSGNCHDGMSGRRDEQTALPGKINYAREGSGNGGGFYTPLNAHLTFDKKWYLQEARAPFARLHRRGDFTVAVWVWWLNNQWAYALAFRTMKYISTQIWRLEGQGASDANPVSARFTLYFEDGTNVQITTGSTITRLTWHHLCATWNQDDQTAKLYVDGELEGTASTSGKVIRTYNDAHDLYCGGIHYFDDFAFYDVTKDAHWVELAHQVAHQPRTATADVLRDAPKTRKRYFLKIGGVEEIFWDNQNRPKIGAADTPGFLPITRDCLVNWRMNARVATADEPDFSDHGHTATGVSDPPVVPYGVFWAEDQRSRGPFTDTSDQFTVANDPRLQPQAFTVVSWGLFKGGGAVNAPMIAHEHSVRVVSWGLKCPASGADRTYFELWFDDGGSAVCTHYDRAQGEGWYMITGTWDGSTARLYFGSTLQSTATPSGGSSTIDYDSNGIVMGRLTGGAGWQHRIGPTAIYKGAKSQEWIHAVYNGSRGYSRPGISCLHLPENEFSLSLDMKTMKVDASAMTFELDNVVDPNDRSQPTKYFFSKLFAPGRVAAADVASTTLRRRELGEEQLEANADTIYSQNNTDFPSHGEACIGQEQISYTGKGSVTQAGFPSNQSIDTFTGCERGLWPAITEANWSKPYPYPRANDLEDGDVGNDQVISSKPYSLIGREMGLWCVAWNEDLGAIYPEQQAELIWAGQISDGASYNPQRNTWSLTGENILRRMEREVGRHFPAGFVEGINLTGERGRYWWAQFNDSNGAPYAIGSFTVAKRYYTIGDLVHAVCTQMNDPSNWTQFGGGTFVTPRFTFSGSYLDGVTTIRVKGTSVHTDGTIWFVTHLDEGKDMENACHAWQAMGFEIKEPFAVTFDDNATVPETSVVSQNPANHHYQPTHPDYNGRHLRAYWKGNDKLWDEQGDFAASPLFRADASGPLALWRCDEVGTGQNLSDSSGNSHTATAQSAAELSIAAGKFDGAQYPNGGAGGWFAAYAPSLQPDKFTISAWIFIATTLTQGKLFQQRSSGGIASAVEIRVTAAGALEFYVMHSDKTHAVCTATTSTSSMQQWTHVQATWDGKTARLYIDGVLEDADASNPGDVDYQVYPTVIGRDHSGSSWPFPGYIDDVAFYDTAFAPGAAWFIFHNTYRHGYGSEKSEYVGAYDKRIASTEVYRLPDAYEYNLSLAPTGASGGDSFDAMYHGHAGFASSIYRQKPLRFQNCYVIQPGVGPTTIETRGPIEVLLFSLLSTGSSGFNGTYDVLPEPLSIGFPEELVDVESFLRWDRWASAAGGTLAARRFYLIEKPVKWGELWKREAQLFGLVAVWEQGQLRCKSLVHPSTHLVDVTLDAASREGRDAFPAVDVSTDNVGNRWTIETAHNLDGEKAKFKPTFNDVESQFGLDLVEAIDISHPGIQNHGKLAMEESIDALIELILLDRAWLYRYAQQRVTVPLAPREFNRIAIADTVIYQALKHPDPFGSGEMEVNAKALVLNYQWSMKRNAGSADLLVFSTPDDFRPWAGCALVDITAANGGWDSINYRFTLVPRHFGAATDSKDGYCFLDTDEVMILESAPEDQDAPQTWGPFAVEETFETDGVNLLTIETATLTGWDSNKEYIIVPATSTNATATQLEENLYQASSTSHLIPASTDPHRWG